MPRYFLNIRDPYLGLITDPEGDAAADLDEVSLIVAETIRDILARPEAYGTNQVWSQRSFEVTDEAGCLVLIVPLSAPGT